MPPADAEFTKSVQLTVQIPVPNFRGRTPVRIIRTQIKKIYRRGDFLLVGINWAYVTCRADPTSIFGTDAVFIFGINGVLVKGAEA